MTKFDTYVDYYKNKRSNIMNEFDYLAKAKKNMEKEKYHEVISFCDKALKINNNLPEAYSFKGNALYYLGEYNDAAESFSFPFA